MIAADHRSRVSDGIKFGAQRSSDPLPRVVAWGAVLIAGAIPEIIWQEWARQSSLWLPLTQCVALVLAAIAFLRIPRLRGLTRFLLAIAALGLGWDVLGPWLGQTDLFRQLSENASWGASFFLARTLPLAGALLVSLTLIGSGLTRRELFLSPGNLAAPARPIPFLGLRKPVSWAVFGPAVLLVFGIALPLFLYFSVSPDLPTLSRILSLLPWILAVAVLNAANEEFQFRNVPLALLRNVIAPAEAVLITAVFFGLGHFYGQPSGPIGMVMAGVAGWIWARSMIETGGFAWAFFIHMVQDIVIFLFLAAGAAK